MRVSLFEMHKGPKPTLHAIDVRPGIGPLVTQLVLPG